MELIRLETKVLVVALLVGIAHFVCGVAVLAEPSSLNVTMLAGLHHLTIWLNATPVFAAAVLMLVGGVAVIASLIRLALPVPLHAALFIPQELLLLLQIWTIGAALVVGQYPDGYTPTGGGWFVLADQILPWVLAISHSVWLGGYLMKGPREWKS